MRWEPSRLSSQGESLHLEVGAALVPVKVAYVAWVNSREQWVVEVDLPGFRKRQGGYKDRDEAKARAEARVRRALAILATAAGLEVSK